MILLLTASYKHRHLWSFLFSFLSLIASLTVAGIPSGGLVTSVLILQGLNINHNQIGLIFTVDWFV